MAEVRVGTSGWHYPTGKGSWDGVFYPSRRSRGRNFDELRFYAEHFDTVEVNSTFYGQPRASVSRQWAARTPPGFEFSVKLYQKFTHPRMYRDRVRQSIGDTQPTDHTISELARPTESDIDEFRLGIEPLAEQNKLGVLLAQFPPSFRNGSVEVDYVTSLLRAFDQYPLAVELRHRSWSDQAGETLELLNNFRAAWVQIDEPKFRFSIRQNYLPNVRGVYYMRLHGRNFASWWKHEAPEDRYDYLYSADELSEFTGTIDAARRIVKKLYLYTNNHFAAKSVANAVIIKQQLGEPVTGMYSDEFMHRYPELKRRVPEATAERTST